MVFKAFLSVNICKQKKFVYTFAFTTNIILTILKHREMKKLRKVLFVLPVLLFTALTVSAQSTSAADKSSKAFLDRLMLNIEFGAGATNKDATPISVGFQAGYKILPQLSVFASYDGNIRLYDNAGVRRYDKAGVLGGGLEYRFAKFDNISLGIQGKIGTSVGNTTWKQNVYDIKLIMRMNTGKRSNVSFGLGYRHINSQTKGISDFNGLYGTIGIGI